MCHEHESSHHLVQAIFEEGLELHPAMDIAFEAFARAEARLSMRFVPQWSNEERLTGHLVSEMESAIFLASEPFRKICRDRYGSDHQIDFAYKDLSQGGHVEKLTGADLAIILVVDLPDRPKIIRYAAIQAKKLVPGSNSIDKEQYDTLRKNFDAASAYLFYDCDPKTLAPPMILSAESLGHRRNSNEETKSFATDQSHVFDEALPFSLWLVTELAAGKAGTSVDSFDSAMKIFSKFERNRHCDPSRLAIISVGRSIQVNRGAEGGLNFAI